MWSFVSSWHLDEDALAGAELGGCDDITFAVSWNKREALGTAGVVQSHTVLHDVRDPVLEHHEHIRGVILAQTVTSAEILVDPDLQRVCHATHCAYDTGGGR